MKEFKLYENKKIVLITRHLKEQAIKPILERETGCQLIVEDRYNTDRLGTFSREVKRRKSQTETARKKIKKALKLSREKVGIASEGSFLSHPMLGIPWNIELVLFYDKERELELCGIYEGGDTNFSHKLIDDYRECLKFAREIGFPAHQLILRPDNERSRYIIKDIDDYEKLEEAYRLCYLRSKTQKVFIETDMRAFANPTRMKNIERATEELVAKLLSLCPKCKEPGFIIKESIKGLPCEVCGFPSELILKNIYECHKCKHREEDLYPNGKISKAEYCNYCNP